MFDNLEGVERRFLEIEDSLSSGQLKPAATAAAKKAPKAKA